MVLRLVLLLCLSQVPLANTSNAEEAYEVFDSFGKHFFVAPPQRIVVTDWTLLEQLMALGVTPVGAPELASYRAVMPFNDLPDSVQDIGLREKPKLDAIGRLSPDLIIVGTDQKQLARPLSRYARVLFYQNFSPRFDNNGLTAIKRLRQLAEVVRKRDRAEEVIASLEQVLEEGREHLRRYYDAPRIVTLLKQHPRDGYIRYSSHSIFGWVIEQLGLQNNTQIPINKFGELRSPLLQDSDLFPGEVICLAECALSFREDESVSQASVKVVADAWPYGGVLSMIAVADEIVSVLTDV
ncbi:MAG: ABC transporter substrate-binding protein [Pseudomonadota bacterium]